MSTAVLNQFVSAEGVSVACAGDKDLLQCAFDASVPEGAREKWKNAFDHAQKFMQTLEAEDQIKIALHEHTLLLRHNKGVYIGVVAVKGHPVIKSLQRMIRRGFKKMGAPIGTKPTASQPQTPAPTPASLPATTPGSDSGPSRPF